MYKILIVEDDPDARRLTEAAMRLEGFSVTSVARAEEALGIIETEKPDAVVADLGLNGNDGEWLVTQMKLEWLSTVVVVVSAQSTPETINRLLKAGVFEHFVKPVLYPLLARSIRNAIRNGRVVNRFEEQEKKIAELNAAVDICHATRAENEKLKADIKGLEARVLKLEPLSYWRRWLLTVLFVMLAFSLTGYAVSAGWIASAHFMWMFLGLSAIVIVPAVFPLDKIGSTVIRAAGVEVEAKFGNGAGGGASDGKK